MKGKDTPTVADNPQNKSVHRKFLVKKGTIKICQHVEPAVLATSRIITFF